METVTRIRKIYKPLSLSTSVNVSGTSISQVVNQFEGTTEPTRSASAPTILRPIITAVTGSADTSWTDGNYAKSLTEVKWLCNGVDISVSGTDTYNKWHNAGSALFEIVHSTDETNGSLRIWRNLEAQEMCAMQMQAKFLDSRTGRSYEVLTDAVDLTCMAMGDSEWDFSIVHDVNIQYNPCLDRLKLYDYLVAAGKLPAGKTRNDYTDATAYEVRLPIIVTHGHTKVTPTDNVTFRLFDHINDHAEITLDNCLALREFTKDHLLIDQRYLPDETVVIDVKMYVKDVFQSQEQLTFTRNYPTISATPTNMADIDLDAATRRDKALVTFNGEKVDYPEAFLRLDWSAKAKDTDAWVAQGFGEEVTINQAALKPTSDLFVKLTYRIKSGLVLLSNEEGALIENSNGKLIVADVIK